MNEEMRIAYAMDGKSKTLYIKDDDGVLVPGLNMKIECASELPDAVVDAINDAFTEMQRTVMAAMVGCGIMEG